ncbi:MULTISPECIES: LysR family transcriptional regulator [Agrobacterium]|uniref:HTH-type transcriptional regulator TtuA n=2 Tax=Pseudomonadota TaxID=1224 RepID=A0A1R3TWC6_9HYPH|nr:MULTISPECIES: LysR substrate-binding domain-containing protein [Agrobacterium]KAA3509615.1 LysR family transcriptional regulator [Agrobacterium rosae]KAA3516516.1 LysR family transcriptional regulator [Agrobacterium rosae]MBN7806426.1 LysR family transcriptional regulator [Agrobacterium rosae]MBN7806631.1 LysR family transcriptional regulator [Agrobacterium rosae]MCM2435032.1 LysR family transcriptional regulator [Agrobacterium rosae]
MAIDLLKMRYFAKIAELGSFTRASTELGVAQPALSSHMRTLEEQLGVLLLNRTPRGAVVTEAGQILLSHAQAILRAVEQAEAATKEQAKYPTGDVSLGILSSICPTLTVPVIEECSHRFPKIRLTVSEGDSQALRTAVETRVHDLAVTLEGVAKSTAIPLFDETLYALGPRGRFSTDEVLTAEEALGLPLILPTRRHGIRILLERQALLLGRELNIVREIEGVASTKAAIRAGHGLTIFGRAAAHVDHESGDLSAVAVSHPSLTRRLVLDMPVNHPTTRAVNEVRNILLAVVRRLELQGHWTCLPQARATGQ